MDAFIRPSFLNVSIYITEILSVLVNSLVIQLALTETNRDLGEYRSMIILNGVIDLTCSSMNVFTQPRFELVSNLWVHVLNGPAKYTPECLHVIWSGAYSFILSLNICSLPLTFYFRYLLIKRGRCLNGFELIKLAMFPFAASLFFWTAFSSCFYVSNWKFPEHSFLHDNPFLFNAINSSPTIVIAELTSIPMYIVISVTAFGGLLVLWIILFCSWSIYLELKKVREEHAQLKTLRLQRQMTITLSVQTLGVFASALLPLFILITLMVCKFDVQGAGSTVSLILSFLPSLNPLSTLMFVTRFRRRAFTLLFCGKRFGYKIENTTEATASMRQTKMAVSTIR